MAQVGARIAAANGALAGGVGRGLVFCELFVLDVEAALAGEEQSVAGGTGGKNAIHHVDSHAGVELDFVGVADTHDVARFVFGQERQDFRDHFEGELTRLADTEAADGVAVEIHFDEAFGALAAEIAIHTALDDSEEGLRARSTFGLGGVAPRSPSARDRGHPAEVRDRALGPGHGEAEAFFGAITSGGVLGALVEGHDDVCAESNLDVDGVLGGEEVRAAVEVGAELDAVGRDFAEGVEGKDLEAAGVSEDGAGPADESMQAAHAADGFVAGAQIEVVGVAEDDFDAEGFERVLGDGFNSALRADGHEDGGFDGLVGQEKAAAATAGGGCGEDLKERGHGVILVDSCRLSVISGQWAMHSSRLDVRSRQIRCCCSATDAAELFILLSLDQVQHKLKDVGFLQRNIPATSDRCPLIGS